MTKTCLKCHESKPITFFNKAKVKKDGLATWCKSCTRAASNERKARNRKANSRADYKMPKTKMCTRCKLEQPGTNFSFYGAFKDGLNFACKKCEKELKVLKKYGIDNKAYSEMLSKQDGACAICLEPETEKRAGKVKALAVDHDHKTGKVRSLLCARCNTALGSFKDDIHILESAIAYLKEHN